MNDLLDEAIRGGGDPLTGMMGVVANAALDPVHAARQTVIQALRTACVQTGIDPKGDDMSASDLADVVTTAIRNLILANGALDVSIYMLATEAFEMKIWLAKGASSWDEYVDLTLLEGDTSEAWRQKLNTLDKPDAPGELVAAGIGSDPKKIKHWLKRTVPNVLYPAKQHPVEVGGVVVDHEWLARNAPSASSELTPLAGKLDLSKPEDVAVFQDALKTVATDGRDGLREFKQNNGLVNPRTAPTRTDVQVELVQVVDVSTGETRHEWRVPSLTFETEPTYNFFWMALSRRFNFHITTRTEKHGKPKSAQVADRRGTGRKQPVHSVSGRHSKKR